MTTSRAQVQTDLACLLANFNGHEYSAPISPETLFFADLGLASIDAVLLGDTLEQRYGQKFPFGPFLSGVAKRGARDISVGELAAFLHEKLEADAAPLAASRRNLTLPR